MNKIYVIALTVIITAVITAFTLLSIFQVDTDKFVSFIQLGFAAVTSVIGTILLKKTGDAVDTATVASEQVAAVSDQIGEVKTLVNGNTANLIARVGPVIPQNDTVITTLTATAELHETGEH